ncbi:MAG: M67 family metallopeptidase [Anaerolineales bacterium]|nr:M67 family metallopeptidase [Anaerolineales bacterium]MCW5854981.1 M67 family metallopeptidase [Anaerolineales bacterium]
MALRLPRRLWQQMRRHVAAVSPQEACGLLAGRDGQAQAVYAVRNELVSPTHFRMDAAEQWAAFQAMEAEGLELLAIYHSHPNGPAGPSQQDILNAGYPGVAHLIWSPVGDEWACRAFLLDTGAKIELELQLQDE